MTIKCKSTVYVKLLYMIVAVDTGGTKTLVAGFTLDGKTIKQMQFPTPANKDKYIEVLKSVLTEHFSDQKADVISLGIAGTVKDGAAIWCNNLKWQDFDIKSALGGTLGGAPIIVENDANLAGLSEARMLDGNTNSALYITIGTGIGSGIISGGYIDESFRLSEAGRSLIEFNGKLVEWESFASGKAIYRDFGKYAREIEDPNTWQQIAERISLGFLTLIPSLQPSVIIIGGGIGTHFSKYSEALIKILTDTLPEHIALPNIISAKHPEHAVIHGCYFYATDYLNNR